MKTIYIAGKISGLPFEEVVKKFAATQTKLEADGYNVINPIELLININLKRRGCGLAALTEETDRVEILKMDIHHLMTFCNAVYLLTDWLDSNGAIMESHIAKTLGMELVFEDKDEPYCIEIMSNKADKPAQNRAVDAKNVQ